MSLLGAPVRCVWCDAEMQYIPRRGWVHAGGHLYVVRCASCGWKGPDTKVCPRCLERSIRDDHCGLPNLG